MILKNLIPRLFALVVFAGISSGKKCYAPMVCEDGEYTRTAWTEVSSLCQSKTNQLNNEADQTTGQKAEKGEKGQMGVTADPNVAALDSNVTALKKVVNGLEAKIYQLEKRLDKINETEIEVISGLQAKIDKLEMRLNQSNEDASKVVSGLQTKIDQLERKLNQSNVGASKGNNSDCHEGFSYKGNCYFVVMQNVADKAGAEKICLDNGGSPSDIVDMNHQTMFEAEVREKDPGTTHVWTAMTYQPSTRTVRLSNGNQVATSNFRWHSIYPTGTGTGIKMQLDDKNRPSQTGLFNSSGAAKGTLCEK